MTRPTNRQDVLIVGAGPTGLALALWLTRQGIGVRIVDKNAGPGESSRAMAVQARTLELYRQVGLADEAVAAGHKNPAMNLWVKGKRRAQLSFGDAGAELTPYPFLLVYPQDRHERLLIRRLAELGVTVQRQTELLSFEEQADGLIARITLPDGSEQSWETRYLAGCDGAGSRVRHQLGAGFAGGTYPQVFYVADALVSGIEPADEAHIALDTADFAAVLSYGQGGYCRLIGTVSEQHANRAESLTFDDVSHHAIDNLGLTVEKINWFSTYRVHHRVTDRFRQGRVFLLGDAAHVHSPAGGQGMNTGILDANNLAWKLAAVLKGNASTGILDSYEPERMAFARRLVNTTDKVFTFATADGGFADFVRTRIAPAFASAAYRIDSVREFLFRVVSQIAVDYPDSPLSEGKAGDVRAGERLPWVVADGVDNYTPLSIIGWQVHVYGTPRPDMREWCERNAVALHIFAWSDTHRRSGLAKDAVYLLRPDTYIGFADPEASVQRLNRYFRERGISPTA